MFIRILTKLKPLCISALLAAYPNVALSFTDEDFQKAAVPGKVTIIINYLDQTSNPVSAVRILLDNPPEIISSTTVRAGAVDIGFSGIESCGEFEIRTSDYVGSCEDVAKEILYDTINNADVWICNAFKKQENKPLQFASCFTRTKLPGNILFIGMIEDELVGLGSHRIVLTEKGIPLRPDLLKAQDIAIQNRFLMWNNRSE